MTTVLGIFFILICVWLAQGKIFKNFCKRKGACSSFNFLPGFEFRFLDAEPQAAAGSAAAFVLPFVEGTQQAAAATAGLEEYVRAGAATDLRDAMVTDGVFSLNAFGGHLEFGMEMGCGASGAAATDLPAATFLDGVFTNAFGGHCGAGMDGASGAAATDLPAAKFFDGPFRLHDFEGHGRAASVLGTLAVLLALVTG